MFAEAPRTDPFFCNGEQQYLTLVKGKTLCRRRCSTNEVVDAASCVSTPSGCDIEQLAVSPSGVWAISQRNSGQGEWGYDVIRVNPLQRVAGIPEEAGYMLEMPVFSKDESFLLGAAGEGYLGYWWAHPDDDPEGPSRGGRLTIGFIFVHSLPGHEAQRHLIQVDLPHGWCPEDSGGWYGPTQLKLVDTGISMQTSWGAVVVVPWPLPQAILLPTPDVSGKVLM